jgi:hypothetical protein
MGDTGDDFRAMREESKERRADNREASAELLRDAGIEFLSKNDGAHLIIEGRIDFWPGTGLWVRRSTHLRARGVKALINFVKTHPQESPSFSPNFDERNRIK